MCRNELSTKTLSFLRTRPDEATGVAAPEALADAGAERSVVAFIEEFLQSNASIGLKIEALETLEDIDNAAALALLEKHARSNDRNLRAKAAEILADRN